MLISNNGIDINVLKTAVPPDSHTDSANSCAAPTCAQHASSQEKNQYPPYFLHDHSVSPQASLNRRQVANISVNNAPRQKHRDTHDLSSNPYTVGDYKYVCT
jgi:hypothetical protein